MYGTIHQFGSDPVANLERFIGDVTSPWGEGPSAVQAQEDFSDMDVGPTAEG